MKVFHSVHRIHGDAVTKMERGFAAVRSIESESTDLLVGVICWRKDADKQAKREGSLRVILCWQLSRSCLCCRYTDP